MAKISTQEAEAKAVSLNLERAKVIHHVMQLRQEQARLKAEIAQLAADSGDLSILKTIIVCW